VSGSRAEFVGDGMAAVVQAVDDVRELIGQPPVVVGGLAVLCRLSRPHRATTDLDLVDRLRGQDSQLQVLRAAEGARSAEPAAVLLPTRYGEVRVDVLEVRQRDLEEPSDDPGDRLHATAHAWAFDTATRVELVARRFDGVLVRSSARVAEPGPLVAMKLQAVMDRGSAKQATDLLDIVRLTLDPDARDRMLIQLSESDRSMARDIALHVDLWLTKNRAQSLRWIQSTASEDVTLDDLELVGELLSGALPTTDGELQ
jgi:hypothetical protein